jgi:two-component system, NarL family, nitrate/nitrite response regulator NarL
LFYPFEGHPMNTLKDTVEQNLPSSDQGVGASRKKILLADDHVLLAEAIASAMARTQGYATVITSTLEHTLRELASGMKFDLVMLDLKMPGMMGLRSIKEVIAAAAPAKVVLISGNADRALVQIAVENGARGLIPKTIPFESLISVVNLVLSGQVFIPAEGWSEGSGANDPSAELSDKEIGILRMASEGLTNKEIALAIGTTEVAIKMHMRSICRQLAGRNRAHAVTIGLERGLI